MDCKRAAAATVLTFLFLLACRGGVISGYEQPTSSSSSAAVKHLHQAAMHARKLLINATATGADPRRAAAAALDDDCSEAVVQVSQVNAGRLPNGIPSYSVTITNMCLGCTVRDVHVSCGEFATTELVDPSDFRRLAYGDCLVRGGGPIGPGDTVSFEYSNSFSYTMDVASVSCSDV